MSVIDPEFDGALLEREQALLAGREVVASATAGAGGLLFYTGPVGVGKSAVLTAIADQAADDGALVLRARASDSEREFAFGVVLQLFEEEVAGRGGPGGPFSGRASLAAPLLTGEGSGDPGAVRPSPALIHALYRVTANLAADRPLVLVIDDLQDADPESLQFAAYLAPRISRLGCSLIAGLHGAAEFADGYPDPLGFEDARVERLAALAEPTVREIVTRRLGSCTRRGATVCHWLTGGNPMLVRELVTAAEQAGLRLDADSVAEICADAPARVRHRMLGPFGPLEPDALAVARAVAVVGSAAERAPVAAITGLPEEALATAIDSLEASEILDREHPLEYVYPLLRAAVYSLIPREERGRLHARAAQALRGSRAGDPATIATHLMRTAPDDQPWVVEELLRAAGRSRRDGELDRATLYLGRALREPPAPEAQAGVLVELGRTQVDNGETEPALATLRRAARLSPDAPPAALALGRALYLHGETREAAAVVDAGRAAGSRTSSELEELDASWLAVALIDPTLHREAKRRLERLARVDPERAAPALLANLACHLACAGSSRDTVAALANAALAGDQVRNGPETWAPALQALCWAGEAQLAATVASELASRRSIQHSRRALAALRLARANANHLLGNLDDAELDASRAATLIGARALSDYVDCTEARRGAVLLDRGDVGLAEATIAGCTGAPYPEDSLVRAQLLSLRGRIQATFHRDHEALHAATEAGRLLTEAGIANPSICAWRSQAAIAAAAIGDTDRARELVEEELELAHRFGATPAIGVALTAAGTIATGKPALDLLVEAEAVLADSDARLEHARALTHLGASLRHYGSQKKAREMLTNALGIANTVGSVSVATLARAELRLAGSRPRSDAHSGPEALTAAEQRVTELAAGGLTNREIAQELYVTRKTVEWHLHNAFRKLEVKSRSELASALAADAA